MRSVCLLMIVLVALTLVGCGGGGGGVAATTEQYTGTWTGTLESYAGVRPLVITIAEDGTFTGTYGVAENSFPCTGTINPRGWFVMRVGISTFTSGTTLDEANHMFGNVSMNNGQINVAGYTLNMDKQQ